MDDSGFAPAPQSNNALARAAERASSHASQHDHSHSHTYTADRLRLGFFLTIAILAVEIVAGLLAHSLAVLSDGAHVLTDVAALGLAWFAAVQARKPSNARWTYGYHRVGILTALANGSALVLIVVVIGVEAYARLLHPEPVQAGIMVLAGLVAVGANLFIAFSLRGESHDLNSRAALLHVVGDIGASVAVIVGAGIIALTGASWIDPALSVVIAAIIAVGALRLIIETVGILLNAAPAGIDVDAVAAAMSAIPQVHAVHDLHVWTIGSGMYALSCHAVIDDVPPSASAAILDEVGAMLRREFGITHTTVQFESMAHDSHAGYCACPPEVAEQLHCDPQATVSAPHTHEHPREVKA